MPSAIRGVAHALVITLCVAGAGAHAATTLADSTSAFGEAQIAPSALLAIDQNRSTVVERIVSEWGDALVRANAGIDAAQLRSMLAGMRADHLLAASLAGTLDGLRNALSIAITSDAAVKPSLLQAKALGDAGGDLVYTPITPCRIVDTVSVGGAIPALGTRSFKGTTATNFLAQGGSNSTCGIPLSAAGLQTAVTVVSPPQNGYLLVYPFGAPQPTAFTMIYQANTIASTAVTIPLTKGQANEFTAFLERTAFLQVDVVGYFKAPSGGYVSSVMAGTGLTGGTITSSGSIAADTTYLQRRVGSTCAVGSSIRAIAADGTVTCQADSTGPANPFVQGGNAFGTTATLGTTDGQQLALQPAAGFVGIGTATPNSKFNVVGTSWFQGDTSPLPAAAGKGIAVGFGGEQGYIFGFDYATFTPKNLLLQNTGGNVGIGTVTPTSGRLHVVGTSGTAVHASATGGVGIAGNSVSNWGVNGYSDSSYGVGGRSNTQIGVYGQSFAALSAGVYGLSAYIGTQGTANGTDANRQAIRGDNGGSATGYAGLFFGNTWVLGTLIKNAGAFRIDHPLDPDNKYLSHSFVESPDMKNIYDGIVTTDGNGMGAVQLPDYFEALNKDFRYQLTVVGQFAQAIVASEIKNNQFFIQTDQPQVKVSWQVTGIRHDTYAAQHRIQVEEDKPADQRGTYIHPAGHGRAQKASLGVRTRSAATTTAQALK